MSIRSWTDLKKHLCHLIIQNHRIYGASFDNEDEKQSLKEYCREIVQLYKDELKTAILCFELLIQSAKDCGWIRQDYDAMARFTEMDRRLRPKR